jgi:hypothetical protein
MSSKSLCLTTLSLLTLVCTVFRLGQARDRSLTVPMDQYERTLRALKQYRILAEEDDGALLQATEESVEPDDYYADAPRLIRLLTLIGDLPAGAVPADSELYQGKLVAAVKSFQSRHGLEPDDRIDTMTDAREGIYFRKGPAPDSSSDNVCDCRCHEERRGAFFQDIYGMTRPSKRNLRRNESRPNEECCVS